MPKKPYSPSALRHLMAQSKAYQNLTSNEKNQIERYFTENNKPVLIKIYYQLLEEFEALAQARSKLAKKILQIDPSEQALLHQKVQELFSDSNPSL